MGNILSKIEFNYRNFNAIFDSNQIEMIYSKLIHFLCLVPAKSVEYSYQLYKYYDTRINIYMYEEKQL